MDHPERPLESGLPGPNISKIMATTEWQPKFDLDSGLEETIKWLKDNSSEKMGEYNV